MKCCYKNCKNRRGSVHLYGFPVHDKERLKKWVLATGNPDVLECPENRLKYHKVCEEHFTAESFRNTSDKRLWPTAIPIFHEGTSPANEDVQEIKEEVPEVPQHPLFTPYMNNWITKMKEKQSQNEPKHLFTVLTEDLGESPVGQCKPGLKVYPKAKQTLKVKIKEEVIEEADPEISSDNTIIDIVTTGQVDISIEDPLNEHSNLDQSHIISEDSVQITDNTTTFPERSNKFINKKNRPKVIIEPIYEVSESVGHIFRSVNILSELGITEICRICANPVTYTSPEPQLLKERLQFVFPEINIDLYPGISICSECEPILEASHKLKQTLLSTEKMLNEHISSKMAKNNEFDIMLVTPTVIPLPNPPTQSKPTLPPPHEEPSPPIDHTYFKTFIPTQHLCHHCGKTYDLWNSFQMHVKSHQRRDFFCEKCGKTFIKATGNVIFTHRRSHNTKAQQCEVCHKSMTNIKSLKRHMVLVHNPTYIQCHVCGLNVKKNNSNRHILSHFPERNSFKCDQCGLMFALQSLLNTHKTHMCNKGKRFYCGHCDKWLTTRVVWKRHQKQDEEGPKPRVHRKKKQRTINQCRLCGRTFNWLYRLKLHMTHFHKKPSFHCKKCDKSFRYEISLLRHLEKTHRIKGKHQCDNCQASYFSASSLTVHLSRKHGIK